MTDVVGYTYRAELLCPNCTIESLKAVGVAELYDSSDEDAIRAIALRNGIDYDDPYSYDSGDFPKPVLYADLDCSGWRTAENLDEFDPDDHERCDGCRANLCD